MNISGLRDLFARFILMQDTIAARHLGGRQNRSDVICSCREPVPAAVCSVDSHEHHIFESTQHCSSGTKLLWPTAIAPKTDDGKKDFKMADGASGLWT